MNAVRACSAWARTVEVIPGGTRCRTATVAPWVRTVNNLRPSALGGVEKWEHQLRAAQGYLTKVSNPSYSVVDFAISKATAESELRRLTQDQKRMIHVAVDVFGSGMELGESVA